MIKQNKAFTLVELIVVITILAILGTIGFLSYQGYSKSARDSRRISDIGNLKTSLGLFQTKTGKYPIPDLPEDVTYSGAVVWSQGVIGDGVFKNLTNINKKPIDPLTDSEYTYSLLNTKKEYEIGGILEGGKTTYINILNETYAAGTVLAQAYITGDYNGIVAKVSTGSLTYVLAVPSIISSEVGDLQEIIDNGELAYDGYSNLGKSYSGTTFNIKGETDLNLTKKILVYSGTLENLRDGEKQVQFVKDLQTAYEGTQISNIGEIKNILSIDTIGDLEGTKLLAQFLIQNTIDPSISITYGNNSWITDTDEDFNNGTISSTAVGNGYVKLASGEAVWTTPIILDGESDGVVLGNQSQADSQVGLRGISMGIDSKDAVHISYNEKYSHRYITNKDGFWNLTGINAHTFDSSTSLLIDPQDNIHLSWYYYGYPTGGLYYVNNTSGTWSSPANITTIGYNLMRNDISSVLDSNDKIHIVFYGGGRGNGESLRYATNESGSWVLSTIDGQTSYYPSIDIDLNNKSHIAYQNNTSGDILYTTNESGSWVTTTIDDTTTPSEGYTSTVVDSNNKVHIAYYNNTVDDLKYATNESGSWVVTTIDSIGDVGSYLSMDIDSQDFLHISYLGRTTHMIKYATNKTGTWVMSEKSSQGGGGWEGYTTSIAVDSQDNPHIAYSYCNSSYVTSLKYISSAATYVSSGEYMSSIYDTEENIGFNNIEWVENIPDGTAMEVRVRTSNDADMASAHDWTSCEPIVNGDDISSNSCVNDGDRYVQYKVSMTTSNGGFSPLLDNMSISYK